MVGGLVKGKGEGKECYILETYKRSMGIRFRQLTSSLEAAPVRT